MSSLKGTRELRARLRAIKLAYKPIGRAWGDETVRQLRPHAPVKTGRLRKSFRVRNATQRKTVVVGHHTAYFIDRGTKAHDIKAKGHTLAFEGRRGTVFTRKVHQRGLRARPFLRRGADEALRRTPMAQKVIDEWNRARP